MTDATLPAKYGPEMRRLYERLCGNPKVRLIGFHVSWGPDAPADLESQAAVINHSLDTAGPEMTPEEFDAQMDDQPSVNALEWLKERCP